MTEEAVAHAASRYRLTAAKLEADREVLIYEIRRAHAAGVRQVDIVKATGWTREQIRRICRGDAKGSAPMEPAG